MPCAVAADRSRLVSAQREYDEAALQSAEAELEVDEISAQLQAIAPAVSQARERQHALRRAARAVLPTLRSSETVRSLAEARGFAVQSGLVRAAVTWRNERKGWPDGQAPRVRWCPSTWTQGAGTARDKYGFGTESVQLRSAVAHGSGCWGWCFRSRGYLFSGSCGEEGPHGAAAQRPQRP